MVQDVHVELNPKWQKQHSTGRRAFSVADWILIKGIN
jgi:hypothetical protein